LRALPEPTLLALSPGGRVALANPTARALLGPAAVAEGAELAALCADEGAAAGLRAYLGRCAGSRAPLPGGAALRRADGTVARFRLSGALLSPASADGAAPARVLLRLSDAGDERFSALSRQVRALNAELRERRRVQAALEEALRERGLLLRELHHRVKNNLHMLAGMLGAARREAAEPGARAALADVERRLAAVGAVHQMLHGAGGLEGVRADRLVAALGPAVLRGLGADPARLAAEAEPVALPNDAAVPLALILNELLTNALKHGGAAAGGGGGVRVRLAAASEGGALELAVEDDGPGFDPADAQGRRRASGLGLVRGLVRQRG
jgi:two-component sensor histidine kinase